MSQEFFCIYLLLGVLGISSFFMVASTITGNIASCISLRDDRWGWGWTRDTGRFICA